MGIRAPYARCHAHKSPGIMLGNGVGIHAWYIVNKSGHVYMYAPPPPTPPPPPPP
eukprot:COSAG02_NODE_31439_length_533_cov_1.163594_2_plen_54_part_01